MERRRLFDCSGVSRRQRSHILACMLFGSVLFFVLLTRYLFQVTIVQEHSMEPTLTEGERVFLRHGAYRRRVPRRGAIVAIRLPGDREPSVKRIVALPLELIQIRDDHDWQAWDRQIQRVPAWLPLPGHALESRRSTPARTKSAATPSRTP